MFDKAEHEKAEVFLRAALSVQPSNHILAILLGRLYLFYLPILSSCLSANTVRNP